MLDLAYTTESRLQSGRLLQFDYSCKSHPIYTSAPATKYMLLFGGTFAFNMALRHKGQWRKPPSIHSSKQLIWKVWKHGSLRISSVPAMSLRQMQLCTILSTNNILRALGVLDHRAEHSPIGIGRQATWIDRFHLFSPFL